MINYDYVCKSCGHEVKNVLQSIKDWDLYLMFIIIDGCVLGKDHSKIPWFINEIRKYKATLVDSSWVLPLPEKGH